MSFRPAPCPICRQPAEEAKFRPFCSAECGNVDLERVREELIAGLEVLAETLMGGPPTIRKPRTWRWGTRGSFVLEVGGRKRGAWHDKESEKGGGPFQLIAHARSCSMAEAIRWARDWTGGTPEAGADYKAEQAARQAERDRKAGEAAAEQQEDEQKRIAVARRLWDQSVAVAGTVAERYLIEVRSIPAPTGGWPDVVRFHPGSQSLILAATLADGDVVAVQRVRLTSEGTKAEGTPEQPTKQTNGVLARAAVRLPKRETPDFMSGVSRPLLLAEGPETGLSLWAATGAETWIALGGMAGVALASDRRVVACRDDDPKHSPADRKMTNAAGAWRKAGLTVATATPWPFRRYDKTDFNDTLKEAGVAGIQRRIDAALNPGGGPPARLPIKEVRERLREAVDGFYDATRAYHAQQAAQPAVHEPSGDARPMAAEDWADFLDEPVPDAAQRAAMPVHAIKVDVGSGKTHAAIRGAIRLLAEMRAAGDDRAAAFAIPTHALGDELAAVFAVHAQGTGLNAAVWRGMSAIDPESPADTMCLNLEAVQDAKDAMVDVYRSTCKRKVDNGEFAVCPFFDVCGYERQRQTEADLWIAPHDLLFLEKPNTIGKLAFLVVDESVWQDGLEGVHGKPTALSLDAVAHIEKPGLDASIVHRQQLERLEFLRNRLVDVLREQADGALLAEPIEASELTPENIREAYRLEWSRFVDPGMHPGMTKAQRREAVQQAAINATIPRLGRMWQSMTALLEDGGPSRSGWVALATQPTDDGQVRVLHLKGRREIRKGWQVPTLLIDATMNVDLVRPYWPDVELLAELLADAPHQRIRQVVDRAYSKSAIEPLAPEMPGYSPEEAKRRARGLRAVHAVLNREARQHDAAPALVVVQKAVEEALPEFGPMATNIDLAHHNAVAGRDQWRAVRQLIVVGRTQPAPASVERLAEALTGAAVTPLEGWYGRGDAVRHAAGSAVAIEADRHPDPTCEAIRWQVCEGELVQIIGRGRGVNRTEDDPLDVLVLADSPLPLPVAATLQAADLAPSPADFMLAAGGLVFENAADAAAAYPELWATRNAANHALKRWRAEMRGGGEVGAIPLIESIIRGLAPTSGLASRIAYQVAGAGKSPSVAWCDPALVPEVAEWLTRRLGTLAWCRMDGQTDPPPSPSAEPDRTPRPEPPVSPGEIPQAEQLPAWLDDAAPWSAEDLAWATADRGEEHDTHMASQSMENLMETEEVPAMHHSGQDQPGLDPATVYGRGVLEPPHADNFVIHQPNGAPIRIRGRPGALTQMPRSALTWPGALLPPGFTVDCSRSALLPDDLAGVRWCGPEPGD